MVSGAGRAHRRLRRRAHTIPTILACRPQSATKDDESHIRCPSRTRVPQASILWTVAIALALHHQVVARRAAPESLERWYHLICWGVPCVLALALLLSHRLGPADEPRTAWCWIASEWGAHSNASHVPLISDGGGGDARWVQLLAFYVPLALAFAFNLITYVRVGSAFRRMVREGAVEAAKERMIQLRLRLYLAVFLLVWLAPLTHRALELFGAGEMPWLRLLHTATQCSMGWLNALIYGCNEATLRPYRDALSSLSCSLLELTRLRPFRRERSNSITSGGAAAAAAAALLAPAAVDRTRLLDAQSPPPPGAAALPHIDAAGEEEAGRRAQGGVTLHGGDGR